MKWYNNNKSNKNNNDNNKKHLNSIEIHDDVRFSGCGTYTKVCTCKYKSENELL